MRDHFHNGFDAACLTYGVKTSSLWEQLKSSVRNATIGAPGAWDDYKRRLANGTLFAPDAPLHHAMTPYSPVYSQVPAARRHVGTRAPGPVRVGERLDPWRVGLQYALPAVGLGLSALAPPEYRGTATGGALGGWVGGTLGLPLGVVGSTLGGVIGSVAGSALGHAFDTTPSKPTTDQHSGQQTTAGL